MVIVTRFLAFFPLNLNWKCAGMMLGGNALRPQMKWASYVRWPFTASRAHSERVTTKRSVVCGLPLLLSFPGFHLNSSCPFLPFSSPTFWFLLVPALVSFTKDYRFKWLSPTISLLSTQEPLYILWCNILFWTPDCMTCPPAKRIIERTLPLGDVDSVLRFKLGHLTSLVLRLPISLCSFTSFTLCQSWLSGLAFLTAQLSLFIYVAYEYCLLSYQGSMTWERWLKKLMSYPFLLLNRCKWNKLSYIFLRLLRWIASLLYVMPPSYPSLPKKIKKCDRWVSWQWGDKQ